MSVKVNLLPGEVQQRGQANRQRGIAAAIVGLVVVLLGVLTFLQRGAISDAEARLASVDSQNAALQAEIAALQPFADLEQRALAAAGTVEAALGDEVSFASVLQDLSLVFPPSAELTNLQVTVADGLATPSPGGGRLIAGRVTAQGQVVSGLSPGVERLLIDFSRAASFDNTYITNSTIDENGVATFSLETELGPEVATNRYVIDEEVGQ